MRINRKRRKCFGACPPVSLAGAIMVLLPSSSIHDAVKKATVAVVKSIPGKTPFPYSIVGSGFCIDPEGIIVTCEHVFRQFFTPETREREQQARQAAQGETFTGDCVIPYVLFYLGVREKEHRVASTLVPVRHAVKDEKHGFDLALLRLPRPDKQVFPEGYPKFSIADYAELHEMMEIATCGFPLGEALHDQIGTVTSSFTKGMISSIIPAQGVAREHVRGFQLDLTTTNGNSGGPVFSLATGEVFGVLQRGVAHPGGYVVQGLKKAEPVYPLFDTDLLARLPASEPPVNPT
jgi:S1-C subfamily serine protease